MDAVEDKAHEFPRWTDYVDVDDLKPDPRNPKGHADDELDDSLKRFGYTEQVLVDERTGMLVAGHGRRELVLRRRDSGDGPPDGIVVDAEGRWLVPVQRGWASKSDEEAGAYLVASNRLTEVGGWQNEGLADLFRQIEAVPVPDLPDFDAFQGLGFDEAARQLVLDGLASSNGGAGGAAAGTRTASTWEPSPPVARDYPVTVEVLTGDSLELLRDMADESIDAVVTDPPYGLEFMGKDWDTFRVDERSARWAGDERTGGAGAGFADSDMGQLPSYGKRRTTSTCKTCGKRDAFRNPHKCDADGTADWITIPVDTNPIEMRAFQNWVTQWAGELYRILKPGGHVLAFGGTRTYHRLASGLEDAGFDVRDSLHWMYGSGFPKSLDLGKHVEAKHGAEAAEQWAGWGTALKPAHEPIVMARKYLDQTTTATVMKYGTGGLNIDATRVAGGESTRRTNTAEMGYHGGNLPPVYETGSDDGRWPTNILFTHAPGCTVEECEDGCPVAYLDDQTGVLRSGEPGIMRKGRNDGAAFGAESRPPGTPMTGYGDEGGASRFMPTFTYGDQDAGMPVFFYHPKASTPERNAGLDGLPIREVNDALEPGDPGYNNPRAGAGRGGAQANFHPTVKPVALMRWLIRLVCPTGAFVLDPFAGSGTTAVAAVLEGVNVVAIEKDADYLPILNARVAYAERLAEPVTGTSSTVAAEKE